MLFRSALQTGTRAAGAIIQDNGTWTFAGHQFRSHGDQGLGPVDMRTAITRGAAGDKIGAPGRRPGALRRRWCGRPDHCGIGGMHRAPPSIWALVRKVLNTFQLSTGTWGMVLSSRTFVT